VKEWLLKVWFRDDSEKYEWVITGWGDSVPLVFYYEINDITIYMPWDTIERLKIEPMEPK
jgi:hypothetical protein